MPSTWTESQRDALREVGNIGCGRAISALSQMLKGQRLLSEVPRSFPMVPGALAQVLGSDSEPLWIAYLSLNGGLSGHLLCILPSSAAGQLLDRLLEREPPPAGNPATALSALSEAANIMGSAYLDGVAALAGLSVVPSPPSVEREPIGEIEAAWWRRAGVEAGGLGVATAFRGDAGDVRLSIQGQLVLLPSTEFDHLAVFGASLDGLARACASGSGSSWGA